MIYIEKLRFNIGVEVEMLNEEVAQHIVISGIDKSLVLVDNGIDIMIVLRRTVSMQQLIPHCRFSDFVQVLLKKDTNINQRFLNNSNYYNGFLVNNKLTSVRTEGVPTIFDSFYYARSGNYTNPLTQYNLYKDEGGSIIYPLSWELIQKTMFPTMRVFVFTSEGACVIYGNVSSKAIGIKDNDGQYIRIF